MAATSNGEPITKAQLDEAFNEAVKAAGVPVGELQPRSEVDGLPLSCSTG